MIRNYAHKKLRQMAQHYDYDTSYMEFLLEQDLGQFLRFTAVQGLGNYRGQVPPAVWFCCSLRTIQREDCGPCIQLVARMAAEQGVPEHTLLAILQGDASKLDSETQLALDYTDAVLERSDRLLDLRQAILERWGKPGIIALGFAITTSRMYPTLKYALGYGHSCQAVNLQSTTWHPEPAPA